MAKADVSEQDRVLHAAQERIERRRASSVPPPGDRVRGDHALAAIRPPVDVAQLRHKAHLRARTDGALDSWLQQIGVGKRHRKPLDPRLIPQEIRDLAPRIAEVLEQGESALLAGPPGTGKTCAAIFALRAVYAAGQVEEAPTGMVWETPRCLFLDAADLVDAFFRSQKAEPHPKVAVARNARLLVIDDWGATYESDWALAAFDRLINHRSRELRSTIVTTNLSPDDFSARYPRAHSRLLEGGPGLVVIDREDLRQ